VIRILLFVVRIDTSVKLEVCSQFDVYVIAV
jgi:hypothetical protein